MYTYNITFIIEPQLEDKLISYLRNDIIKYIYVEGSKASDPSIRKVIEAGGEKPGKNDALSIALAFSFPTEEDAYRWHDHILLPSLENFHSKFGNNSIFFITLLENISL